MSSKTLLLVADDHKLAEEMQWHFSREGFRIRHTTSAHEALSIVGRCPPDIVILDWMIESIPGTDLCAKLRCGSEHPDIPILMLAALPEEGQCVRAFNAGSDDCVSRPFRMRELMARITAIIRRASPELVGVKLTFHDLEMDLARHKVRRRGRIVTLAHTEFRILRQLLESPGRIFSRERLIELLWAEKGGIEPRTIDAHIRRLRNTLNKDGGPDLIRTIRLAGYALDAP